MLRHARLERRHPLLSSPITDALLAMQNRVSLGELVVEQGKNGVVYIRYILVVANYATVFQITREGTSFYWHFTKLQNSLSLSIADNQ